MATMLRILHNYFEQDNDILSEKYKISIIRGYMIFSCAYIPDDFSHCTQGDDIDHYIQGEIFSALV